MSYTRHYHATIHGSASKTVSVNGQSQTVTVHYSEPVNIAIHVDTNSFDNRVDNCRSSVSQLQGAVVATQAAEVAMKHKTSKQIGNTLLNGFFTYIRTDLSQQIKEFSSRIEAKLIELVEQGKDCLHRKDTMGADYNRITKRYSLLFADLDKELGSRIRNLAQPVFNFAEQTGTALRRPVDTGLLGIASVAADETFRLDATLKSSSIKCRAQGLINKANSYLGGTYRLQNSLQEMLRTGDEPGIRYLPVAYVESVSSQQGYDRQIFGLDNGMLCHCTGLENKLNTNFQNKTLTWHEMDAATQEHIQTYFNDELNNSGVSARVAAMIGTLRANNRIKTLK